MFYRKNNITKTMLKTSAKEGIDVSR